MQTLTRESHDVIVGLMAPANTPPTTRETLWSDISHCGQLNNTISTLLTPTNLDVPLKLTVILAMLDCIVSSCLAHKFPSSPVSVGMFPSNKTLDVGVVQIVWRPYLEALKQFPVMDDPFTDLVSAGKISCVGSC